MATLDIIPNKWHLSGWGRPGGVRRAMNNGFLMKMSIYTQAGPECLVRCQYLLFAEGRDNFCENLRSENLSLANDGADPGVSHGGNIFKT